jgi:hypothetical protein
MFEYVIYAFDEVMVSMYAGSDDANVAKSFRTDGKKK